jgi:hypothetical protein
VKAGWGTPEDEEGDELEEGGRDDVSGAGAVEEAVEGDQDEEGQDRRREQLGRSLVVAVDCASQPEKTSVWEDSIALPGG